MVILKGCSPLAGEGSRIKSQGVKSWATAYLLAVKASEDARGSHPKPIPVPGRRIRPSIGIVSVSQCWYSVQLS